MYRNRFGKISLFSSGTGPLLAHWSDTPRGFASSVHFVTTHSPFSYHRYCHPLVFKSDSRLRCVREVFRSNGDYQPGRAEAELGQMFKFHGLNSFAVYVCAIRGVQIA